MMKTALLKISAIFSYCGGPLFIATALKRQHGGMNPAIFIVTFLPIGLMVIGALCLEDDPRSRWSAAAVWAGRQGLYVALGMHVYALWCFAHGTHVLDQRLHYFGIGVGLVWSVAYLRAAHRWASARESTRMVGPASTDPIEPS